MKKLLLGGAVAVFALALSVGIVLADTAVTAHGEITSPANDGDHVVGTLNLAATYEDGDVPNTDDGVQWAVRLGTCAAGQDTVLGNVDGHSDTANWDGNNFSFTADVSHFTPGNYCFVFNPKDDPGQPDVRLTRKFVIDDVVPNDKSQCAKGGWKNYLTPSYDHFMNQGECISFVNTGKYLVETLNVDAGNIDGATSNAILENGNKYRIEVSGTWANAGGKNVADAEYVSSDNWVTYADGPALGPDQLDLQIDKQFVDWGAYNTSHDYGYVMEGNGQSVNFRVFDGDPDTNTPNSDWYGDNSGSLTVRIYQLP